MEGCSRNGKGAQTYTIYSNATSNDNNAVFALRRIPHNKFFPQLEQEYFLHNIAPEIIIIISIKLTLQSNHKNTIITHKRIMPEQWTKLEDLRYHFFLILHIHRLYPVHRKTDTLFKKMETFMRTKDSKQCRSHHQKRADKKDILAYLKDFYHEYYEIRLLDTEHIVNELRYYLTKVNPTQFQESRSPNGSEVSISKVLSTFSENLQFILNSKSRSIRAKDQTTQTDFKQDKQTQTDGLDSAQHAIMLRYSYDSSQETTQLQVSTDCCRDALQQ